MKMHKIRFGGTRACAHIDLFDGETEGHMAAFGTGSDGQVFSVNNEPSAATVRLLRAALRFVFLQFPNITGITLKDTSSSHRQSLPHYYLAKHLQTWYQAKVGAKLFDTSDCSRLEQGIRRLTDESNKLPWAVFHEKIACFPSFRNRKGMESFVQQAYVNARTYHEFFRTIMDDMDCSVLRYWFDAFMSKDIFPDLALGESWWIVDRDNVDLAIVVTPMTEKPAFNGILHGGDSWGLPVVYRKRTCPS